MDESELGVDHVCAASIGQSFSIVASQAQMHSPMHQNLGHPSLQHGFQEHVVSVRVRRDGQIRARVMKLRDSADILSQRILKRLGQ